MTLKRTLALIFVTLIVLIPVLGNVSFAAESNEQIIYKFLKNDLGFNDAQACGILANIYGESRFDPKASCIDVDGFESYGLCQWHVSRLDSLRSYCAQNGLDSASVAGQMQYLKYELLGNEVYAYSTLLGLPNTADGAYKAGYNWSKFFGRGASSLYEIRGNLAKNTFWEKYKSPDTSSFLEIQEGTYCFINNSNGLYLTVPGKTENNGEDVSVGSYSDSRYFKFSVTKGSNFGYIIKPVYTTESVLNVYTSALVQNGKNVTLWTKSGSNSQEWKFKATSDGYVISSAQNPDCVLGISDGTVKMVTYSGASSQIWTMFSYDTPAVPPDAVTPSVKTGAAGFDTEFSWSEATNATEYDIIISDAASGARCVSKTTKNLKYKVALQAGSYIVIVNSVNNLGNSQRIVTEGPEVCFNVLEGHSHDFNGKIEILSEATCSHTGFMKVYCTDEECGQFMTVETPKLDHKYSTHFVPANTESSGVILKVCDVCGDTVVEKVLPKPTDTSPMIVVSDKEIEGGKSAVVPVTLKNAKGIAFGMFSLNYDDTKLTLKSITTSNGKVANFMSNGSTVYFEVPKSDAAEIVFDFTFTAKPDVYGNTTVSPSYVINAFSSSHDELVYPAVAGGKVGILRYDVSPGDANCDGDVTASDLLLVRKNVAGLLSEDDLCFSAADANHDTYISMSDVMLIRKYIAGIIESID